MSQGNLDDLIIGGTSSVPSGGKKPSGKIVIIALVIIILFVAVLLIKSIMGTSSNNTIDLNISEANTTQETAEPKKEPKLDDELEKIGDDVSLENSAPPVVSGEDEKNDSKESQSDEDTSSSDTSKKTDEKTTDEKTKKKSDAEVVAPKIDTTPKPKPTPKPEPKTTPVETEKTTPVKQKETPPPAIKTQEIYKGGTTTPSVGTNSKPKPVYTPKEKPSKPISHASSNTPKGYYIQVGVFTNKPKQSYIDNISSYGFDTVVADTNRGYSVRIGPFQSYDDAKAKLGNVREKVVPGAFIINNK